MESSFNRLVDVVIGSPSKQTMIFIRFLRFIASVVTTMIVYEKFRGDVELQVDFKLLLNQLFSFSSIVVLIVFGLIHFGFYGLLSELFTYISLNRNIALRLGTMTEDEVFGLADTITERQSLVSTVKKFDKTTPEEKYQAGLKRIGQMGRAERETSESVALLSIVCIQFAFMSPTGTNYLVLGMLFGLGIAGAFMLYVGLPAIYSVRYKHEQRRLQQLRKEMGSKEEKEGADEDTTPSTDG
jgi:hypothetical protein